MAHKNMELLLEIAEDDARDDFENLLDVFWLRWHNPPAFFQDPPMVSHEVAPHEESERNLL
jgi:hypothetical protein